MNINASVALCLGSDFQRCLVSRLHVQLPLRILLGTASYNGHAVVLEITSGACGFPQVLFADTVLVPTWYLFDNCIRLARCSLTSHRNCVRSTHIGTHLVVHHCAWLLAVRVLLHVLLRQDVLVLLIN